MKNEKGITLIALIITIIVMLILVGVTINVALNGGLFEKAKDAKTKTQKEVDKETLLSAVVATVDKNGNFQLDQVGKYLPEGEFTYNSTTKVYKSKNGNEFTINETTGKVEEYVAPTTPSTPTQDSDPEPEPSDVDPIVGTYTDKYDYPGLQAVFNEGGTWVISSEKGDIIGTWTNDGDGFYSVYGYINVSDGFSLDSNGNIKRYSTIFFESND